MAGVIKGRYTTRIDEPFAVFIIGCGFRFTKTLLFNSIRRLCSWSRSCPAVEKGQGCK